MEPEDSPPGEVDRVIKSHGIVFHVDEMSLVYLAGTEIGFVEGLQATGFTFRNPNVTSTCGCGSSFSA
jgi:iron-sulfur cluster insertion protein